jgi:hypothetical protein
MSQLYEIITIIRPIVSRPFIVLIQSAFKKWKAVITVRPIAINGLLKTYHWHHSIVPRHFRFSLKRSVDILGRQNINVVIDPSYHVTN